MAALGWPRPEVNHGKTPTGLQRRRDTARPPVRRPVIRCAFTIFDDRRAAEQKLPVSDRPARIVIWVVVCSGGKIAGTGGTGVSKCYRQCHAASRVHALRQCGPCSGLLRFRRSSFVSSHDHGGLDRGLLKGEGSTPLTEHRHSHAVVCLDSRVEAVLMACSHLVMVSTRRSF